MIITKEILNSYLEVNHPELHNKWINAKRRPVSKKEGMLDLFDIVEPTMKDRVLEAVDKNPDKLHLRIDSPGGDIYSLIPMINALKTVKHLTTENVGIAASAAAAIFMLGDDRITHPASQFLFHRAWTVSAGNALKLRAAADRAEHFDQVIYDTVYTQKMQNVEEKEFYTMLEKDEFMKKDQLEYYGVYNVVKEEKKAEPEKEIKNYDVKNNILTSNEYDVLSSVKLFNRRKK